MSSDYSLIPLLIIAFYIMSNCVCTLLYAWDKRSAMRRGQRISEKNLLLWTFVSGGLLALAAQQIFRHKTQKLSFQLVAIVAAISHLIIWFWVITQ